VAYGDTYFATRLYSDAWLDAFNDDKEAALITATLRIDQENFDGVRVSPTVQALKWPRYGVELDGVYFLSTEIPKQIKDAVCEMALELLTSNALEQSGLANFKRLSVGPISLEMNQPVVSGALPAQVLRLLSGLRVGGSGARMVRA
jgi:hypothetical protein